MVVAQLVERLLLIPEDRSLNPVIVKNLYWTFIINCIEKTKKKKRLGEISGLVVMGRDSHSKGRGFESQHQILDGGFFTYICCKNCNICLIRPKINEKEAGVGPFKKSKGLTNDSWLVIPLKLKLFFCSLLYPPFAYVKKKEKRLFLEPSLGKFNVFFIWRYPYT